MRHLPLVASLLFLAACSEAPTDPAALDVDPRFAKAATEIELAVVLLCPNNVPRAQLQFAWTNLPGPTDFIRFTLGSAGPSYLFTTLFVSGSEKREGQGLINQTVQVGTEYSQAGFAIFLKNGNLDTPDLQTTGLPFTHPGCPLP